MYNHAWASVEGSLKSVLPHLEALARARKPGAGGYTRDINYDALTASYQRVLYECAEFIEVVCRGIWRSLSEVDGSVKIAGVASLRRHVDIITNKLKHDQNRIVPAGIEFSLGDAYGYAVCSFNHEGTLGPNPDVHIDESVFMFGIDLRKVLAQLYLIAALVGEKMRVLHAGHLTGGTQQSETSRGTEELLVRIDALPVVQAPRYSTAHVPIFQFDGEALVIALSGGRANSLGKAIREWLVYVADGATRSFNIPYLTR
jgi:hypothetical protein